MIPPEPTTVDGWQERAQRLAFTRLPATGSILGEHTLARLTPLQAAAMAWDARAVAGHLSPSPRHPDTRQFSTQALHVPVERMDLLRDTVDWVLHPRPAGTDPREEDPWSDEALQARDTTLGLLIAHGAPIGTRALRAALEEHHGLRVLERLLRAPGLDLTPAPHEDPFLHTVVRRGKPWALGPVVAAGADPNAWGCPHPHGDGLWQRERFTALGCIAELGGFGPLAIRLYERLVELGADPLTGSDTGLRTSELVGRFFPNDLDQTAPIRAREEQWVLRRSMDVEHGPGFASTSAPALPSGIGRRRL